MSRWDCAGTGWIVVPGTLKLKQIEVGANGDVCGVTKNGVMYHRMGVSAAKVLGTMCMQMYTGVSHATTGVNGKYLLAKGTTYE
ncbi:tectonin domain-containing protein, partial [Salmonella sp. s54412]|uniref:tectonin domain-containing protein n=1 Tax=Salmonella sp. s54412 TaxID=3160128 RepID=UPI0037547495